MNNKPLILITNDDGVDAKGIKELTECLREVGDLVVLAPDGPRSGMSSAITSSVPLTYTLVKEEKGLTVYKSNGTPVDCVKLALNEVLDRKPDLLVSGINHGGNYAICVNYSGTMGGDCGGMYRRDSLYRRIALESSSGRRLYGMLPVGAHVGAASPQKGIAPRDVSEPECPEHSQRKRDQSLPAGGRPLDQ